MNFEQTIEAILNTDAHVGWEHATAKQLYAAVSKAALARVYPQWQTTHGGKRAAYLSAEFLIGRVVEANGLRVKIRLFDFFGREAEEETVTLREIEILEIDTQEEKMYAILEEMEKQRMQLLPPEGAPKE